MIDQYIGICFAMDGIVGRGRLGGLEGTFNNDAALPADLNIYAIFGAVLPLPYHCYAHLRPLKTQKNAPFSVRIVKGTR